MNILITGTAGFIGFYTALRFLQEGHCVIGIDNMNSYYDVSLKEARNNILKQHDNYIFYLVDIASYQELSNIFKKHSFDYVVHLAAQAGVRYSLDHPFDYVHSNIVGFMNILECCRHNPVKHLVYASSSSVYGLNSCVPFSVHDNVDHPVSLYAATKKSNELFAHCYSHLYSIPSSGLRFFTVYGPWGRPDMAYFKFTKAILENKTIDVYNFGDMERDFTYIDDIVEGVYRITFKVPQGQPEFDTMHPDPASSSAPFRIYNIGNNKPVQLMYFIEVLEKETGKKANINFLPMQPGDVLATFADIDELTDAVGYRPVTSIEEGLHKFVQWYKEYYKV
ncbi:MAG TPA: NAD-dependent epimerase [Spirochaetota bacterium]|nr:NAD-dependent epimerase [Spirochaetota bacterium]HOM09754.1 NAD-dependent epimerase [Spirochaetota bacterium]HPP49346.1 NAD-dependent epimerase [Spirochaetota bacterium]